MKRSVLLWLPVVAVLMLLPRSASASIKWVEKPLYLYGANTDSNQKWDKADEGPTRNTGAGICAAVAIANSFSYLYQRYPDIYEGTGLIPLGDNDPFDVGDLDELRDALANLIYTQGNGGAKSIWDAKYKWLTENAAGTTILDGQVYLPGVNLSEWTGGSVLENKYPDFEFLWTEIKKCEDVELGMFPVAGGDGHSVTLTGVSWDDDCDGILEQGELPKSIRYLDPNGAYTTGGDGTPLGREAGLIWENNRWEINYWDGGARWYIYRAYSESPIPEPGTIIVWSLLGLASAFGAYLWRRRARSR